MIDLIEEYENAFDPISFNSELLSNEIDDIDLQRAKQPGPTRLPFRGRRTGPNDEP
jgi:hypothetical protein